MRTLNNVATGERFELEGGEGTATLRGGPCVRAEVSVYNHAAYITFKISSTGQSGQAVWSPSLFMVPEEKVRVFLLHGIFGIAAQSAVGAEPARVTIALYAEDEIWTPRTPTPIVQQLITQPVKELNTTEAAGILATAA
jgi:hypothetical protein